MLPESSKLAPQPRSYQTSMRHTNPEKCSHISSNHHFGFPSSTSEYPMEENYIASYDDYSNVRSHYDVNQSYKRKITASKDKNITSSRFNSSRISSSNESNNSSLNSMVTNKPTFNHPKKKVLEEDLDFSLEDSETEDEEDNYEIEFKKRNGDTSTQSNLSELSLMVKPSDNPNAIGTGGDLSTFDSFQNLPKGKLFSCLSKMESEFRALGYSDDQEDSSSDCEMSSRENYTCLPNYEKIKHFEQDLSDEEFMDIVVNNLSKLRGDITYKQFRDQFLPKHRKPTFTDYTRLRRLEKIMLEN